MLGLRLILKILPNRISQIPFDTSQRVLHDETTRIHADILPYADKAYSAGSVAGQHVVPQPMAGSERMSGQLQIRSLIGADTPRHGTIPFPPPNEPNDLGALVNKDGRSRH